MAEKCYSYVEEGPYFEGVNDDPAYEWVGEVKRYRHANFISIDAEAIIETVQENAFEECGEWANDYLCNITRQQYAEIAAVLKVALATWLDANVDQPPFWTGVNVEPLTK